MNYHLKTSSGRKYRLSAAEYSLLCEYGTVKKRSICKNVYSFLFLITCLFTTNLSAIGNAEIIEQDIQTNEQDFALQPKQSTEEKADTLWVQIELSMNK